MVKVPETVIKDWQFLKDNPIYYGDEFWKFWGIHWEPHFLDMKIFVNKFKGLEMPSSDCHVLYLKGKKLGIFMDLLRENNDKFTLNSIARNLIAHHIGNGLLIIYYIANDVEGTVQPILSENVHKILTEISEMESFWQTFRDIEKR